MHLSLADRQVPVGQSRRGFVPISVSIVTEKYIIYLRDHLCI